MRKEVVFSFVFMGSIHLTNLLIPVLIIPFLIKIVGIENFAFVAIFQTIMSYFTVVVDYGFNTIAVQECTFHKNDHLKLKKLYSEVFCTKMLILFFCLLLGILLISIFPFFKNNIFFFYSSFSLVIAKSIMPLWFFQGMQKLKYAAFLNAIGKIILFFLLQKYILLKSDYIYINLIFSLGDIFVGILSLLLIYFKWNIYVTLITFRNLKVQLYRNFSLFISNIAIVTYGNLSLIILSFFAPPLIVGAYAIAEKVIVSLKFAVGIFLQSTYSYTSQLALGTKEKFERVLKMELKFLFLSFFAVGLFVFLFSDNISIFFVKNNSADTRIVSTYIKYMCLIPLIVSLNTPAFKRLLIFNHKNRYTSITVLGALISIFLNTILAKYYMALGVIISIYITELFITIGLHINAFKVKKHTKYYE